MIALALAACRDAPPAARTGVSLTGPGLDERLSAGWFVEDEVAGAWTAVLTGGPGCRGAAAATRAVDDAWAALDAGSLDPDGACEALAEAWGDAWGPHPWTLEVEVRAADAVALLAGRYDVDVRLVEHALPAGLCPPDDADDLREAIGTAESARRHPAAGTLRIQGYDAGVRLFGEVDLSVEGVGTLRGPYDLAACDADVALTLAR